jgi:hypothetical protein
VRPTFGLEIRVEMFHLEGDMIALHDRAFVTWPMTSFCPKTLKKEKSTYVSVMTFRIIEMAVTQCLSIRFLIGWHYSSDFELALC